MTFHPLGPPTSLRAGEPALRWARPAGDTCGFGG